MGCVGDGCFVCSGEGGLKGCYACFLSFDVYYVVEDNGPVF